ncbi:MAG TPA: diguanylate cyclase [Myxococcales bacterium]|nr:diguanylate cyclase [Myxococcales bacterium]
MLQVVHKSSSGPRETPKRAERLDAKVSGQSLVPKWISRDAEHLLEKDLMNNPLRSLAGRIILLVFAATVVSALTVSWISVQSLDGFLREKVDQRFPQEAGRIGRELDQWYALRTRELEVFAGSKVLAEALTQLGKDGRRSSRAHDEAEQYLRYVVESFPQFDRLVLATPDGRPVIEVGEGIALPESLLASLTPGMDANAISGAQKVFDRLVQIASVPMKNVNDRSLGRLFAMIDLDLLNPTLQSWELGQSANVFIVDQDNQILTSHEGLDAGVEYMVNGESGDTKDPVVFGVSHYVNVQDIRVVGTQIKFPRFGWTLVLEQPYSDAFAPVMTSIARVAGLNLAIVLLVSLVASRLARSFVKPLYALSSVAKRLSEGERGVELDETHFSSDEVNVLTRTFNEMSRGLSRNAVELENSHQAVESANALLTAKNDELLNMNLVLEQLSITDGLTKLHNHRYFQEAFTRECKRSIRSLEPLSLILVDIDFFKKWNDQLGHAGGDEILRRLAEVLNVSVRETDILTRYGGEEFALIALDTDLEGATALGEKIRQAVEADEFVTDVPSEKEPLTISVGVACFNGDRKQLFADADAALYKAKDSGRNRVVTASAASPNKSSVETQSKSNAKSK